MANLSLYKKSIQIYKILNKFSLKIFQSKNNKDEIALDEVYAQINNLSA